MQRYAKNMCTSCAIASTTTTHVRQMRTTIIATTATVAFIYITCCAHNFWVHSTIPIIKRHAQIAVHSSKFSSQLKMLQCTQCSSCPIACHNHTSLSGSFHVRVNEDGVLAILMVPTSITVHVERTIPLQRLPALQDPHHRTQQKLISSHAYCHSLRQLWPYYPNFPPSEKTICSVIA